MSEKGIVTEILHRAIEAEETKELVMDIGSKAAAYTLVKSQPSGSVRQASAIGAVAGATLAGVAGLGALGIGAPVVVAGAVIGGVVGLVRKIAK